MNTSKNAYSRFIEFEERAAAIYLKLASHFSQDPKLSLLWLELAMHEKQHASLLQFCLQEELLASNLPETAEIQKMTELFDRLEGRAADPDLTVEEAFLLAAELETSEVNAIYSHMTTTLHGSMYLVQRKIAASLPDHVENLILAARKSGVRNQAMQELTRLQTRCSAQDRSESRPALKPQD